MRKKCVLLASAAMMLATSAAQAAEPATMEAMQKQIEMLSRQVEKLSTIVEEQGHLIQNQKTQLQTQEEKVSLQKRELDKVAALKAAAVAPAAGVDTSNIKITMSPSPKIESADGKYSFQPIGRVHFDTTVYDDDKSDQADGQNLRRARLGFRGKLGDDFNYKAEVDFGGEATNIKETYLAYTGFDPTELWMGNFKPPVGLEQNTSTNFMSLIENAPVTNALTRDEILGVALKSGGENWSFAGGVFNEDPGVNSGADDEAFSLDAKASADVLYNSPHVLHLGVGGSARKPNSGGGGSVTVSGRPGGSGPSLVTTGAIASVDRSYVYGSEIATVFGPFHAQAEYYANDIDIAGVADASLDGWYAQMGWILTGETRPYKGKTGSFDRIKPKSPFSLAEGGWGALELVTRYDVLNLNDASAGITGGELRDWVVGANWYLTDYVRMMFNVTQINTDSNAVTPDDDPTLYNMRVQWDF